MSFPRKWESILYWSFWIPVSTGMTKAMDVLTEKKSKIKKLKEDK